jgi:hypothetical protein
MLTSAVNRSNGFGEPPLLITQAYPRPDAIGLYPCRTRRANCKLWQMGNISMPPPARPLRAVVIWPSARECVRPDRGLRAHEVAALGPPG